MMLFVAIVGVLNLIVLGVFSYAIFWGYKTGEERAMYNAQAEALFRINTEMNTGFEEMRQVARGTR